MTLRVCLIYPRLKYPTGDPPLGLLYIASSLRARAGVEPTLIDLTFEKRPWDKLRFALKAGMFQIVGISAMVTTMRDGLTAARIAREVNRESVIVLGGPQPTVDPKSVIEDANVDIVVEGEGEWPFASLAASCGKPDGIEGIWYKKNGSVVQPERGNEDFTELDSLPFPAFDLIDWDKYSKAWFQLDSVSPELKGTNILATRGCPYRCSYCQPTLEKIFGPGLRKRSPDNVVEELTMLKARYGIESFVLADDTPTIDRRWSFEFAGLLSRAGLNLKWGLNMRSDMVESDLLLAMKSAGLRKVFIGIESASQRVLDEVYHKGTTVEAAREAVDVANRAGLDIQGYFMLAAPGETSSEMKETIRLARELTITDATFNIATPLPGTELYKMSSNAIKVKPLELDYYSVYPFKKSATGMSALYVGLMRRYAYASFYLSPRRLKRLSRMAMSPSGIKKLLLKMKRLL